MDTFKISNIVTTTKCARLSSYTKIDDDDDENHPTTK